MKKIILLIQLLAVLAFTNTTWAMSQVVDEAQLLTAAQETRLVQQLDELEAKHGISAAVVTLKSLSRQDIGGFADSFLNQRMNPGREGTLVLVQVVDSRQWYISTDAALRDTLGSSEAVEKFGRVLVPYLRHGDYAGAYGALLQEIIHLQEYYQNSTWTEKVDFNEPAFIFALFGAFIITQKLRKSLLASMDNVQTSVAADDYLEQSSFNLLEGSDDYLFSNTVRLPRNRGNNRHDGGGNGGGNGGGGGSY